MKKILTKKERQKIEKRNNTIIGSILVLIMFLSIIGYSFFTSDGDGISQENKIIYNGIEFNLREDGLWHFNVYEKNFRAYYSPKEIRNITQNLEDIKIDSSISYWDFHNKLLYIHYKNDFSADGEILRNVLDIVQRTNHFCFEEDEIIDNEIEECAGPIKSCEDTNSILLVTRQGEENSITQEENCIFLEFKEQESLKVASTFLYRILNII